MKAFEIAQEIVEGKLDDSLEIVSGAIKNRMRILGIVPEPASGGRDDSAKFHSFKINDEVVFNSGASPKYLIGAKATIVGKKQKKVSIKLTSPVGKFGTYPITCPVSIIDKV